LAPWRESDRVTITLRKHVQGTGRLGDLRRGFARPTMTLQEGFGPLARVRSRDDNPPEDMDHGAKHAWRRRRRRKKEKENAKERERNASNTHRDATRTLYLHTHLPIIHIWIVGSPLLTNEIPRILANPPTT